ncbi:MAG: kinase to dihydroxyacetone kinase [Tissierellia bacterium]|nr:kinase to dihydroxyacetone kinase [Tissierellia bacterium]
MLEYRYDTQLLIEGENLDVDGVRAHFDEAFQGDSTIIVGDEELMKIHYHTNKPWEILEYCSTLGEIFDIVVEDMQRQSEGKQG